MHTMLRALERTVGAAEAGNLSAEQQNAVEMVLASRADPNALEVAKQLLLLGTPIGSVHNVADNMLQTTQGSKDSLTLLKTALEESFKGCLESLGRSSKDADARGIKTLDLILR